MFYPMETVYEVKYDFKSERWAVMRNGRIQSMFDLKEPAKSYAKSRAEQEGAVFKSYAKENPPRVVSSRDYGAKKYATR